MTHQAPLLHVPGRGGIWRRYKLPGTSTINAAPWHDAIAQRAPVGTCRRDGGYLFPAGQPYTNAGSARQWYPAACATCHEQTAAPGPAPPKKRARR
ncbi:hypothetical protein [Micromonospora aurantiaca (nom. illeg.)]|uniref:hypothetical protein n=1 Tax=Micromonospora aurantiaca (nom. illeg.) TaxID=47850 RepID=UPI0033C62F43